MLATQISPCEIQRLTLSANERAESNKDIGSELDQVCGRINVKGTTVEETNVSQ